MGSWNKEFHNISINCSEKLVQIKNDAALSTFLNAPDTKGSVLISEYAHRLYLKEIGRPINITVDSIAIEILGHVYLDKFADLALKFKLIPLQDVLKEIKNRTDIIDCGEKEIDPNRFIWDDLEKHNLKSVIYTICGRSA